MIKYFCNKVEKVQYNAALAITLQVKKYTLQQTRS